MTEAVVPKHWRKWLEPRRRGGLQLKADTVKNTSLLIAVFIISLLFFYVIRPFITPVFMAAVFAGLIYPLYYRLKSVPRISDNMAALFTLTSFCLLVMLPAAVLGGILTAQALRVSQSIRPWVQHQLTSPDFFELLPSRLPFYDELLPFHDEIIRKSGEMVGYASSFLIDNLSAGAMNTVNFLFMVFVFLYAFYYFLIDGPLLLDRVLLYLPMEHQDEQRLLARFNSVTMTMVKGTLIIAILQGISGGLIFALFGIDMAVFWGAVIAVLSIIPAIGPTLIWLPTSIFMVASGSIARGLGLAFMCIMTVGVLDYIIRPAMASKDTSLHNLLIFLGTLGGLAVFGLPGFITGPIIAALFSTIWDIYGETFKDYLPPAR